MSLLTLATRDDVVRLLPLVASCHAHLGLQTGENHRRKALESLWEQDIQAAIWLIGPQRAPVGYIAVAFGYSIALGGRSARIDEFFIREAVRGRGMGSQALSSVLKALREMGVRALHIETRQSDDRLARLCVRAGFAPRDGTQALIRLL